MGNQRLIMRRVALQVQLVVQICLHYVLEDRLATDQATGAMSLPRQALVLCGLTIEDGEILVETKDMPKLCHDLGGDQTVNISDTDSRAANGAVIDSTRTVRGVDVRRRVSSNQEPSSSTAIGGSDARPCERKVRLRSTGSPPGPASGS